MGTGGVSSFAVCVHILDMIHVRTREKAEFWGLAPPCLSMTLNQEGDWEGHIPQNRGRENLESLQQAKGQCGVTTVTCQLHLGTGEGLGGH